MNTARRYTLLVVDDSPEDRAVYCRYLQRDPQHSYDILEAATAAGGLERCQVSLPDAILLDYRLPDMDGLSFLQLLVQQFGKAGVPVLMLTGQGNEMIATQVMKAGAQDYLVKGTLTEALLQKTVSNAIEQWQLQQRLLQQQQQQQLVAEMTLRIRQSLDLQAILQTTVDEVRQFLQIDRVLIFEFAPGWGGTVTVESVVDSALAILPFNIYDPCIGKTYVEPFQQGLVTAKADIYTADISPCHVEFLEQFQVRANLVVPILKDDALWGLLAAHHCVAPRQWQESEINLLQQLAVQVGVALQQAALFKQVQTELAERERAESALRERERLFSTLAETLPVVIFRFDQHSHCVYLNNYWTTLTGRTIESATGLGWVDTLHPQDRDRLTREWLQWRQNPQQRGLYQNEGRLVHSDGHDIWYYIQALPEVNAKGETIGYLGVFTDISDRKQAERSLQQSEARLRLAQAASNSAVWDWDVQKNTLFWSPEYYQLYELDPTIEPSYEHWLHCIYPDDRERVNQQTLQALDAASSELRIEFRVARSDGMRWLAGIGQVLHDPIGQPTRMIGIAIDITPQKQTELALQQFNLTLEQRVTERTEALAALNQRLLVTLKEQRQAKQDVEDLYNHAPCGYHSLDAEGTIVRINDTALQWLGYTREEVLNQMKFLDCLTPESQQTFKQSFPAFIQRGWVNDLEFQLLHKDGSTRWISVNATAINDEAGKFVMSRSTLFDISDRKQAENILQQYERIIANTTDGIALVNHNYVYQVANQGYLTWCNKPSEEVIGNSVKNVLGGALFDRFIQPRLEQCLSGETIQYERWFDYPNVTPQFLSVTYTPYRHVNGAISGVIVSLRDLTRLKRAEQMLELQAVITRNMAEGICLVRADDATIVYANPKFEQMFGYETGELNGQHVSVVNYADETITAEAVNQAIRVAVLQKHEATYEVHNVKKDGTPFWCSAICSVFQHSEYGDVLVAVHQDITARKQAEVALQQQTQQKQLLWTIAQTIRQSLELDVILKAAVTEVRQILGVDRAAVYRFNADWSGDFIVESVAEGWVPLVEPNVCKVWEDTYLQETQGGRFQNHETLAVTDMYTADLQPCHVALLEQFQARAYAVAPIFVGESLWGLFAIYQNAAPYHWETWEVELLEQISSQMAIALQQSTLYSQLQNELRERQQTEAVLREAERRWQSLLDNVELIVIGLDRDGNIEYANPFFLRLTDYQWEEIRGQSWFAQFFSASQRPSARLVFQEILNDGRHPHHQTLILTKAREERLIVWSNTLLKNASGEVIGTIHIGEDITERYKVERMKAEFIGMVSHELRTPLTSMQAALSLLSEKIIDPLSAEGEATIQIATEGTDRLVRLVNDILALERLEAGKVRLEKRLCQVDALVKTAVAQMQEMAKQAGMTLAASDAAFQVEVDSDRLLQVLTNLLSNAIKFSPSGSVVRLAVVLQQPEPTQAWLLFSVRDAGRGIPPEKLESIFDRFQQVDASDSRQKGGTGLGLAICRSIVQQHGGRIWAESTLGQGSTFYFTLPITQAAPQVSWQ